MPTSCNGSLSTEATPGEAGTKNHWPTPVVAAMDECHILVQSSRASSDV